MRMGNYFTTTLLMAFLTSLFGALQVSAEGLLPNASMEEDADADQWPDTWPKLKAGGSWIAEGGNHFIRITSAQPGEMYMLYREINIPDGVRELTLTWKQRVSDLAVGEQTWFDARIMMEWLDASRGKVSGKPSQPSRNKNTDGWEEKSLSISVPEGAAILKFMPSLFRVKSGTFDLDDVQLTPANR